MPDLQQLSDYPGLATDERFFERAYRTVTGEVARVRFEPIQVDQSIEANIAIMPAQISVLVSASLVDAAGQVLTVGGRGLLRQGEVHSWPIDSEHAFDVEPWLTGCAARAIAELVKSAAMIRAASWLMVPVPAEPAPTPISQEQPDV